MSCHSDKKSGLSGNLKTIAIVGFLGLGGYYLWMQHRAHVLQYLPVAFFLLCPLMHMFGGHGGHGGHDHSGDTKGDSK